MEPAREPPWAEHEKVYLLAEILKAAPISSHALFDLIRQSNIQPRWPDIALPRGRSLRSCQMAYNEIAATYTAPEYRPRPQAPQLPTPIIYPGPDITKKRPHQQEPPAPMGRLLQPRPPHSYSGEFVSGGAGGGPAYSSTISPAGEPASKKKRGRPTKAEAQQRAQEAAARGEVYPPPRRARTSVTASEPASGESRPFAQTPPGPTAAPSGTVTTPQQQTQGEQGMETTSSGKKKRGKPTPLELEKAQRTPSETESPVARGSAGVDPNRPGSQAYSTFTPISAPLPSSTESRDRDVRMEGAEETSQPRTNTPHSFKDTVGI